MLPVLGGISGETSTTLRGGAAGRVAVGISMAFRGGRAMGGGAGRWARKRRRLSLRHFHESGMSVVRIRF